MRINIKLATAIAILTTLIVGTLGMMTYLKSQAELEKSILREVDKDMLQLATGIELSLGRVREDVLFLSATPALADIIDSPQEGGARVAAEQALQQTFVALLKSKPDYWQVRYIDENGWERVRVDANNGEVQVIPAEQLQNKAQNAYFIETMRLPERALYVSPMNLNREQGRIETPYKPTLRFAVPVFAEQGRTRRGMLIINLHGKNILASIQAQFGQMYLVNKEGYFLKHPDASKEFGLDLQRQYRLEDLNPLLAAKLTSAGSLVEHADNGASAESRIHGFRKIHYDPQDNSNYWTLVFELPTAEAFASVDALHRDFIWIGLLVIGAGTGAGFVWSKQFSKPLTEIAERATLIAAGEISVKSITRPRRDEIGILDDAFNRMAATLQEKADVAERIATGDLTVEVALHSERDVLGVAYRRMVSNLRQLADSADRSEGVTGIPRGLEA
jgi:methyl-accepting chemotaxis protein